MTTAVVDASAAVRWFVDHPLSPNADLLLSRYATRLAPQIILSETGNAFWKYIRAGTITPAQAQSALQRLPESYVTLEQDRDHIARALQLAAEFDHPVYDCLYLAVAEARSAPLITDDQRLLGKLGRKRRFTLIALADVQ